MNQELIDYIKAAKQHGLGDAEIKQNLLNAGWEGPDIEDSFSHYVAEAYKTQTSQTEMLSSIMQKPKNTEPKALPSMGPSLAASPVTGPVVLMEDQKAVKKSHWGLWLLVFFILILAGAAGVYYYAFGMYLPNQVWDKFATNQKSQIMNADFSVGYTDNTPTELDENNLLGLNLKNFQVKFDGKYYINAADAQNPQSTADVGYTFSSSGTSFSTRFAYKLKNNVLYLNVGSNPFLDIMMQSLSRETGKKQDWIKLDLTELEKTTQDQSSGSYDAGAAEELKKLTDPQFKADLEKIWKDAKIIKMKKLIGPEKISGHWTWHFQAEADKTELKRVFNSYFKKISGAMADSNSTSTEQQQKDLDNASLVINGILDKIQISGFDIWVGAKDLQLYQVKLTSNAPSFKSLIKTLGDSSQTLDFGSADAKRLADIRQLASALELYNNDYGGYPTGNQGKPEDLTPTYIGNIPLAPTPAEGLCSEYYNTYWYVPSGTKTVVNGKTVYSSYEYTFCLGGPTGGYKAGIAKLTPNGIEGGLLCKDTAEHCAASKTQSPDEAQKINDFISKLDFGAQIEVNATYSDYGRIISIEEPTEYFDILNVLADARSKSRDAKRLADTRQLASALELFYSDQNFYPKDLKTLTPTYIGLIPTAPTPADGSCSETDNTYSYVQTGPKSYVLSFCLGADTMGYTSGKHQMTPAGIK